MEQTPDKIIIFSSAPLIFSGLYLKHYQSPRGHFSRSVEFVVSRSRRLWCFFIFDMVINIKHEWLKRDILPSRRLHGLNGNAENEV